MLGKVVTPSNGALAAIACNTEQQYSKQWQDREQALPLASSYRYVVTLEQEAW